MTSACQKQRNGPALSQIKSLSCTLVSYEGDFTFSSSLCPYRECFSKGQQVPFPAVTPQYLCPDTSKNTSTGAVTRQLNCAALCAGIRTNATQKLSIPCIAITNEHLFSKTLTNRKIIFLTQQLLSEFYHCHYLFLYSASYLAIILLPCYQSQCSR